MSAPFDTNKHHPSCKPHDVDLTWACSQCGYVESADDIEAIEVLLAQRTAEVKQLTSLNIERGKERSADLNAIADFQLQIRDLKQERDQARAERDAAIKEKEALWTRCLDRSEEAKQLHTTLARLRAVLEEALKDHADNYAGCLSCWCHEAKKALQEAGG